jgi:hypothetical protein
VARHIFQACPLWISQASSHSMFRGNKNKVILFEFVMRVSKDWRGFEFQFLLWAMCIHFVE